MKKIIAMILVLVMVMALAACGGETTETTAPAGETTPVSEGAETTAPAAQEDLTVALVVAGTFGDQAFYDSSRSGCQQLVADYGVTLKEIECNNEGHDQQIYNAADAADIVVLVGWEFYNVETIAPEYPDVKFLWVDNVTSADVENVLCIPYAQNEGSFLAGYVAGKMSTSGVVGAVGGEDSATINDFIVGFSQGAKYANPDIEVVVNYSNTYDDPAVGKECALALYDKGADVIFQVCSKAGEGVFQAAQEKGFYAIGVDSDQKYIAPDVIICSMIKEVGKSIYDAIAKHIGGDESLWGTTWLADMSNEYIGVGYGEDGTGVQVPDEIKTEVEALAGQILSGEIVVDTTR